MKIEKIVKENSKEQGLKVLVLETNATVPIDFDRLRSMIYYLITPTSGIQTSLISFRALLRNFQSQDPDWKSKLTEILKSLNCTDPSVYIALQSGYTPSPIYSSLSLPPDTNLSIHYLFTHISHANISEHLQSFFATHETSSKFKSLLNTDPILIYEYAVLLYKHRPQDLIDLFTTSIGQVLEDHNIEEIVKFIRNYADFLRVIPTGKLLHIVYSQLSLIISGPKGAYLLAEYFHNALVQQKLPENPIELYMLCGQKDVFEAHHSKLCIERLLIRFEVNLELELCNIIKTSAGPDSMEITSSLLKEANEYKINYESIQVIVMTKKIAGVLKFQPQISQEYIPKELPFYFENSLQEYNKRFHQTYEKKVVKVDFLSSFVEMQYGTCKIICNFIQALILLLFNAKESISAKEIM